VVDAPISGTKSESTKSSGSTGPSKSKVPSADATRPITACGPSCSCQTGAASSPTEEALAFDILCALVTGRDPDAYLGDRHADRVIKASLRLARRFRERLAEEGRSAEGHDRGDARG
jgi:hypothetical protein